MNNETVKNKSFDFSVKVVLLKNYLCNDKKEFILSDQLLRSATSVASNLQEADFAVSKSDFYNKLSISLKEANEALYWLKLLKQTNYITESQSKPLLKQCNEIIGILHKSIRTTRDSLRSCRKR